MFACLLNSGVDSIGECDSDSPHVGTVAFPFRVEAASILHSAGGGIALDEIRTEHFGESALSSATPQVHLKEPILGLHEPLREEQIALLRGGDMRNAPPIPSDPDRRGQPLDSQRSRYLRQSRRGSGWRGRRLTNARRGQECRDENYTTTHGHQR